MLDERFFAKYQRFILLFSNTWLGRLYLCSAWNKYKRRIDFNWLKVERFHEITPSSCVSSRRYFLDSDGELQARSTGKFFASNYFAKKFSFLLFWLPYWKGHFDPRKEVILKPQYAFPLFILLNYLSLKTLGLPFFFGTVSTFQPAVGANSPVDGYVLNDTGILSTWADVRNASAGTSANSTNSVDYVRAGKSVDTSRQTGRAYFVFNTGGTITAGATINATSSTNLKFTTGATGGDCDNDGNDFFSVLQSSPASDSAIATGDFDQITPIPVSTTVAMTEGCDSGQRVSLATIAATTEYTFVLNATGRGWIAASGETKPGGAVSSGKTRLAIAEGHDILDDEIACDNNSCQVTFADNGSAQPTLSVDWTAAAAGTALGARNMLLMGSGI